MRKFGSINLHDDVVLSDNEMKKILGGSGSTESSCSAKCGDNTMVMDHCNGKCEAVDEEYVKCIGETQTWTKSCNKSDGSGALM